MSNRLLLVQVQVPFSFHVTKSRHSFLKTILTVVAYGVAKNNDVNLNTVGGSIK